MLDKYFCVADSPTHPIPALNRKIPKAHPIINHSSTGLRYLSLRMNAQGNYHKNDLTAAEAMVLLNPNGDNSRQALLLMLREASLRGYIVSSKGSRMVRDNFLSPIFSILVIMAIGVFLVPRGRGAIVLLITIVLGAIINFIFTQLLPKKPSNPLWLISLTPKGQQILRGQESSEWRPLLSYIEQSMRNARSTDASYDSCTFDELLLAIKRDTPSGGEFLDSHILRNLVNKGLLTFNPSDYAAFEAQHRSIKKMSKWARKQELKTLFGTPRNTYAYTEKGTSWREQINQQIQEARALPQYLRSRPEDALAIVSSIGIVVLLVPHIEGHFAELGQLLSYGNTFDPLNPLHRNLSGAEFSSITVEESEWTDGIKASGDLLDGNLNGYERDFNELPLSDGSDGGGGCSSDSDSDGGDSGGDGCGGGCGGD